MSGVGIHEVRPGDLDELAELCREHAAFDSTPDETPAPLPDDLAARMKPLFFGAPPAMWCHVADACVLMDCLYVRDGYRGHAVGRRLFDAGVEHARRIGATRLQWQAPGWNGRSQRFYDRTGADGWLKVRYTLQSA